MSPHRLDSAWRPASPPFGGSSMLRSILIATLVAGTLDILSAFVFAGMAGMSPGGVLTYVASGPFGDGVRGGGPVWAAAGLAVHFAIMACMAAAWFLVA